MASGGRRTSKNRSLPPRSTLHPSPPSTLPHLRGQNPRRQCLRIGPERDVVAARRGGHRSCAGLAGESKRRIERRRKERRRKERRGLSEKMKNFFSFFSLLILITSPFALHQKRKEKNRSKEALNPSYHIRLENEKKKAFFVFLKGRKNAKTKNRKERRGWGGGSCST